MKLRRLDIDLPLPKWLMGTFALNDGDEGGAGGGEGDPPADEPSLHDDVVAAMEEQLAGDDDGAGGDQTQRREQARDDGGRFTKNDGAAGGARQTQQPAASAQTQQPKPQGGKQPAPAAQTQQPHQGGDPKSEMPADWTPPWLKAGDGLDPKALPPALRQQMFAREQAFSRFARETGERAKAWEPVEKALAPIAAHLKSQGGSAPQFVSSLVQVEAALHEDSNNEKPTFAPLRWLAENYYQMPLEDLLKQAAAAPATSKPDPVIVELQKQVGEMRGALSQRDNTEREAAKTAMREKFQAFLSKNPNAADPEVQTIMKRLLRSGEADSYETALEKASWLHPPLRAKLQQTERKQASERARTAAISPRGSSPINRGDAGGRVNGGASIDEDVRATFNELSAD